LASPAHREAVAPWNFRPGSGVNPCPPGYFSVPPDIPHSHSILSAAIIFSARKKVLASGDEKGGLTPPPVKPKYYVPVITFIFMEQR